ncbi:hypothetical protein [Mycobacterium camsae]|uniref:hypothetical protein n=1 Tax=Mycobacterium gordonae TaxID=1778 RepID=UPI0019811B4A|nr:hypothetical protein [Mycobacterium gordonae]
MITARARTLAGMTLMATGLGLAALGAAGPANAAPGNQPPTGSYTCYDYQSQTFYTCYY